VLRPQSGERGREARDALFDAPLRRAVSYAADLTPIEADSLLAAAARRAV
jgi:hypothetical protein